MQRIIADPPLRGRRGQAIHPYPLSGHIRCAECRTPLAGLALSGGKGRKSIRYYGCRNRNLADRDVRCGSRYVRADTLETRLVEGLRKAIADPHEIVSAYNYLRASATDVDKDEIGQAKDRVAEAEGQMRRLARLARFADEDEAADTIAEEMQAAALLKRQAEADLADLLACEESADAIYPDPTELALLSEQVAAWLDPEDPEKVKLALDGLDVTIFAGGGEPHAIGHLPVYATYKSNSHPDVCSMVSISGEGTSTPMTPLT